MLLGLIYISDAGFARLLNGAVAAPLALGEWGQLYWGAISSFSRSGSTTWPRAPDCTPCTSLDDRESGQLQPVAVPNY
jgi:hypothetical protein